MIRQTVLCAVLITALAAMAFAQNGTITGKVQDKETGEVLGGANVFLDGTSYGSSTNNQGEYSIAHVPYGTYTLVVSYIGYGKFTDIINVSEANLAVDVQLSQTEYMGERVVVTASRRAQKITEAPATIDVISAKMIDEHPSPNLGELLAYEKGVDYVRTGVVGTGMNVRGFNSAFNPKNLQLTDNRFSTLISTGLPYGTLNTTVKEDVERVEVILGPSAALYGPNAHNGLLNTITKDPRSSQGTSVVFNGGNQSVVSGRFRHAQVLNDKLAFKVTGAYTQGTEFSYVDTVYSDDGERAFDELALDKDFDSLHGEAAVYISPTSASDIILSYGGSLNNNLAVTNAGRNQIKDWQIHIVQARYVAPHIFAQAYHTWSITDDTYAINQRTRNYHSFLDAGFSEQEARTRSLHEAWVGPMVGGVAINREANFKVDDKRWNGEVQYNNSWSGFDVTAGVQVQRDRAFSKHTFLLDENGVIQQDQIGVYGQVEKGLGESGFKLVLAARGDDHEVYGFNFVPKAALLYTNKTGTWRFTYGKGIAAPTILNLSMDIFSGLALGNGDGFTLSDGSKIAPLEVETIQTLELGYKGTIAENLYLDANAYYNMSEDFISPLINIAPLAFTGGPLVTERGNQPISELQTGLVLGPGDFVLANVNFGNVDTYGLDVGINYYFNNNINLALNYSYFDFSLDKDDPKNDGNKDGKVEDTDLPINTPQHKLNAVLHATKDQFFGALGARWIDEYDFFSGINVAAKTNTDLVIAGDPVVENQRVGRDFNEGPLGGFVNIDISAGYRINKNVSVSAQVINVFDSDVREFVASPAIGRLFSAELKLTR